MKFLRKLLKKDERKGKSPKPLDIDKMMQQDFHCCESIFRHQSLTLPRFSEKNPATVGFLIDSLFPQCKGKIRDAISMSLDMTSSEPKISEYHSANDLVRLGVCDLMMVVGKDGERYPIKGCNCTILIRFEESAPVTEVMMHLRGAGGYFYQCMYTRVSIMIPHKGGEDDLRAGVPGGEESLYKEGCLPSQFSFLIVEEHQDIKRFLLEHDAIEKEVERKLAENLELSELEQSVYRGYREFNTLSYYIGYGRWLVEQRRWYDAYRQFIRVYHVVQKSIQSEEQEWFYSLAYDIGKCLNNLERYDEAVYFLKLAATKIESANTDLGYAYLKLGDIRISNIVRGELDEENRGFLSNTKESYNPNSLTIGDALNELFGAMPGSLLSIILKKDDNDEVIFINTKEDIWDMPLSALAVDQMTAVVMFSNTTYETDIKLDNSILCTYSSFVIRVNKVKSSQGNDLFRINIMLPTFNYDADKLYLRPTNIPEGISFILGVDTEPYVDALSILKRCNNLLNCGRLLESGHAAKFMFNMMLSRWKELSGNEIEDFYEAAFQVGYSFMECRLMQKAYYYLEIAAQRRYDLYLKEFVNCLCNSYDPRAISIIDSLMKMELADEDDNGNISHSWRCFLKRRKSYILIEGKKFSEAEQILLELLSDTDPINSDYAKGELDYINEIICPTLNSSSE